MPRSNSRSRKDSSDWGVIEMARERPIAAAAAAAGAAAAGLFLWSKRNQISHQINSLGDQIGEWTDSIASGSGNSSRADDTGSLRKRRSNLRSGAGSRSATGKRTTSSRGRGGASGRARGTRKIAGASAAQPSKTGNSAGNNS